MDQTRTGEKVVLYHRETKRALVVNATGSLVWTALTTPCSREELVAELRRQFPDVPEQQLTSDLEVYLGEMLREGVILEHA